MGAEKSKVAGLGDELYKYPRKQVEKISGLKVADHIMFQRPLYEHHGIIVAVNTNEGKFEVIEYNGNKPKPLAKVERITHTFSKELESTLYVVQYKEGECLPDDQVIENAKDWLDAEGYNILLNNCECMAQACKTGERISEQVTNLFKFIYKKGTRITKFGAPMLVFGGIAEAAFDIHNIVKHNKEGKLNDRRRDAMIGTRVVTEGGDIGGGVGGMVVSGVVAGPVGAVLGRMLGCLGGRLVAWGTSKGVVAIIEKSTNHFEDNDDDKSESSSQEDVCQDEGCDEEEKKGVERLGVGESMVHYGPRSTVRYCVQSGCIVMNL